MSNGTGNETIVNKAISYIEDNLDSEIGLQEVANHINYSYYHTTRIFSAVLGESVGSYINKRRLYEASQKLIFTNQKVIEIAFESGFESSEAFSRAFKRLFNFSPTKYRNNGLDLVVNKKGKLDSTHVAHISQNISVTPQIVETKETVIIGIRGETTLTINELPKLWAQYMRICKENHVESIGYSVCETANATYLNNDNLFFSVMIGSPAEAFPLIPETVVQKTISGGKYAVFQHSGTLKNLPLSYDYIYGVWAMTSKSQLADRDSYELYNGEALAYESAENRLLIYIPIR
ncbi:hypothetical protein BAU15_06505 [Enterococcus sp. JM4C]|uniref:AraC family transcriptional regulator n=1 Tax=Candidatus Enterococcus huntleyi TaxID=1857217 RepID=UPI00137B4581|nr:AraC family transcriptional regulator [Enterococcus sp. JM4C]KAF1297194.1 hypothetical protein BAU15_06505 [Enterococcus sp. JM4C]